MKNRWSKRWWLALGLALGCGALLLVVDATGGRLTQSERQEIEEDRWVGFHVVYEPMLPSIEEVEADPEAYPPEDRSHWVEYGSQALEIGELGSLSIPREILIGEYQEETGQYSFPGLEGYNAFLVPQTREDGSQVWGGSYDLAHANLEIGGKEQSLSGTIYSGAPEGAEDGWQETEPQYCWRAYNVFQMPDGTIYLDGSGNSYGASASGMGFSSNRTDTRTVNGESETTSLTVEVRVETVPRLKQVTVKCFDGADVLLLERTFSPEEAEEGHVALPADCAWALVEETMVDGSTKRTAYTPENETEIFHQLVLLDKEGMGRAVYLYLDI